MFTALKNRALSIALNSIKEKLMNPFLEGIGVIREFQYREGRLQFLLELKGLEDRPIEVSCEDIKIADDGSRVEVGTFLSNMEFAQNALNLYARKPFNVPEGKSRWAVIVAKKALGL